MKNKQSDTNEQLKQYYLYLSEKERSKNTILKYLRDITMFLNFLNGKELSKSELLSYKEYLISKYAPSSVNSILASINGYLNWLGITTLRVKPLKIQKEIFTLPEKELSTREYERLITEANKQKNDKLSLLIQTICGTGIRVSELEYITVASLNVGRSIVSCKGKQRIIFLPKSLCNALKTYCKKQNIVHGSIFITKTGNPLDRSNIWKMMKRLCKHANVPEENVFPHNLRHLFARTYYKIEKDISKLADILGHSNINTTRIYTMETSRNHIKQLEKMQLIYAHI